MNTDTDLQYWQNTVMRQFAANFSQPRALSDFNKIVLLHCVKNKELKDFATPGSWFGSGDGERYAPQHSAAQTCDLCA